MPIDRHSSNWLTTPIVRCRTREEQTAILSLPAVYALLMVDGISSFPALRPHQKQPLHAFLVQVGALALVAAKRTTPPDTADDWRVLLRGLTPHFGDDEPWCLVVDDLSKPALLQPSIPEGTIDVLKDSEDTPDALDMLVTSKNHDLKGARMRHAAADEWLFALITLQTMEGFLGAGNYGISRMNGGFASRPSVGIATLGGFGARVRRDMQRLIEIRGEAMAANEYYARERGLGLTWLIPWDGVQHLQPRDLDPYYVEVCRRIRLVERDGALMARRGSSKAARIAFPKGYNGVTGDPWAPLNRADGNPKSLTVDGAGFHYRRVADILDPESFTPAPLQVAVGGDGTASLVLTLAATARGQGETQGHHERTIHVPPKAVRFFGAGAGDALARLARERVGQAGEMRNRVLKPALLTLFQNQPEKLDYKHVASNRKSDIFLSALDREIDHIFFNDLFFELSEDDHDVRDQIRRDWLLRLKAIAQAQLATAEAGSPISHVRRYMSRAAAESRLSSAFFAAFAPYFPKARGTTP
jgi:CRISPR system Cascade subunit CasA